MLLLFSGPDLPSPVHASLQITDGRYFVLSDDHCRTHKYLLGLALAIPCVSYDWIEKCIEQVIRIMLLTSEGRGGGGCDGKVW